MVLAEFPWKIPILAATTAPIPILMAPPKADAAPELFVNGANEAAVALGLINPTKNNTENNPATAQW